LSAAPAADHVLRMLALLSHHPEPVSAGLVAATLRLPRSTTYRLLSVLVDHGFVHYLPEERRYGLSVAAYELGSAYARQAPLQRIARPIVRQLVDRMKQNAHLAVLHGRDVLYVIEERAAGRPMLITDVGVRLPAVLTASGLALLARLPAAQVRALFPNTAAFVETEHGPATPSALRQLLSDVRNQGYATEEGSVTSGLSSLAQAALDHTGHPTAAVAVTYLAKDVDHRAEASLVEAVKAAALQLSRRLGFRGTTPGRQPPLYGASR
jgi:DNA-binding IclR family transcriptional regulator